MISNFYPDHAMAEGFPSCEKLIYCGPTIGIVLCEPIELNLLFAAAYDLNIFAIGSYDSGLS